MGTSRRTIKKLVKDGLVVKKQVMTHSRANARRYYEERRLGRHSGTGKRRGTKDARMPVKICWMRRQRALRRLLRKLRESQKNRIKIFITNFISDLKVIFIKIRR